MSESRLILTRVKDSVKQNLYIMPVAADVSLECGGIHSNHVPACTIDRLNDVPKAIPWASARPRIRPEDAPPRSV